MIRSLIVCLLFILIGTEKTEAAKPRFFIQTSASGDQGGKLGEAYLGYFETLVFNGLKEAFPCIELNSISTVRTLIGHERMRQLLGAGDDNALANIAGAMGCEYLVCLKVNVSGNSALITAYCMDSKKAETLARTSEMAAHGSAGISAMEKVAKKLIDDLKEYEICAYEGKLTIEVESEKEETTSSSIPCDGGMIVIQTRITTKMNLDWKLNKNGLRKGDGNVTYDMNEKTETTINNPCYICPDGQKTIAQINEKKDVEAKASGLTNESVSEGQKVADCRIKIVFLEDGTYTILIEATSQKGNMKTTIDKKVNAPCAAGKNEDPEEPRNNEIDVPLKVVLGPYKGTAQDKVLSQDETKDLSQGKEKATAKINFSLTRQ